MTVVTPSFWRAVEALHSIVYFAPGAKQAYAEVGLRGYWRGYFASRAAALGEPGPEVVTATFFGFAPGMVARAVPEVWSLADRSVVLTVRERVAVDALRSAGLGDDVAELADRLQEVVSAVRFSGMPLAAAHASLTRGQDPVARLFHAATVLRELHGDAHIHTLIAADLTGITSNVLAVAAGLAPDTQREFRGWSEDEWRAATHELIDESWMSDHHTLTPAGQFARDEIEIRTHQIAESALEDPKAVAALADDLVDLARPVAEVLGISYPNPTGVARP